MNPNLTPKVAGIVWGIGLGGTFAAWVYPSFLYIWWSILAGAILLGMLVFD